MKTKAFVLSHFLSDLPGHFPCPDDQNVLPRRKSVNVYLEQQTPDQKGNGCNKDAQIIHPLRNAKFRYGIGKQTDADANETDCNRQREKQLPQSL